MRFLVLLLLSLSTVGCFGKRPQSPESAPAEAASGPRPKINVMAPLIVGDPNAPESPTSQVAWAQFRSDLAEIKTLGAHAVSTDVWWGLVEKEDNKFSWDYYERVAKAVTEAGLKWVPILSTHQCGGNVGDDCDIPIPEWIWSKYATDKTTVSDLQYLSEQGKTSKEVISAWSTGVVLDDYRELFTAFHQQFVKYAPQISEINISLGPSGELRYPSYNIHDTDSGYPTRGSFQSYSPSAVNSWKNFASKLEPKINAQAMPPISPKKWIESNQYKTPVGRQYIDWYQASLLEHGETVMLEAINTFSSDASPFKGIDLGAKIPGIHWRIGTVDKNGNIMFGDRLAEVAAGLVNLNSENWMKDERGRGYRKTLNLFSRLSARTKNSRIVLHFTALEMQDGQDKPEVLSAASTLVRWVGEEAKRQNLPIKGENALAGNLGDSKSWERMASHVRSPENPQGLYEGLTVLRMRDVLASPTAKAAFKNMALGIGKN
jgi:beta-amylase